MGPTNVALVKLFQADQQLREAQNRLDAATKNVRVQERRVNDLSARQVEAQTKLREQQARAGALELDLKSRDEHIEKLRSQQQSAKNNKEYQAFLIEINTGKVDKGKIEEQWIGVTEAVERGQADLKDLGAALEGERSKLATMKEQITDTITTLQREIDALRPAREEAAAAVPRKALDAFTRLADHHEGEAMSALIKPDRRREEYSCSACMMDLVTDVYNKLHTRDELVFCPSCRRILYIPDDLPPEMAIKARPKPKEKEPPSSTFDQALQKFYRHFEQGFRDAKYLEDERNYKLEAGSRFAKLLGDGLGVELIAQGNLEELRGRLQTVLTGGKIKLNLIDPRFEAAPFFNSLKDDSIATSYFETLFRFLAEEIPSPLNFGAYAAVVNTFQKGARTWPILTLVPFIAQPSRHMFMKPQATKNGAELLEMELKYSSDFNWDTYQQLLELGRTALAKLRDHGAVDFIDVSSFFWTAHYYPDYPIRGSNESAPTGEADSQQPASEQDAQQATGG